MDSHQSSVSEDHSSDPGSPPKSPQLRSTPSPDSAQTVISGAFFAGAHSFSINGGSFNNSNGDIHQDIVDDHSHRSNFGNRYGDNHFNSNNTTSSYNADYSMGLTNGLSPPQGHNFTMNKISLVLVKAVELLLLRTTEAPSLFLRQHILVKSTDHLLHLCRSEIEQLRMSTALLMDGKGLNTTMTLAMDLLANTIRTMIRKAMLIRKCTMRNRANHNLVNDKLIMRNQTPNLLALLLRGLTSNQTIPMQSCCPPRRW
ncbi:hypothetical protein F5050DRAFT_1435220 [Lentinula boryana]|uniref:Uncharacterized protein n=1 Tax=Lentinula boryana TaxID=40481 RepID=A0ABQ8QFY6_9AGAR|nr:hypothetical protein F5050DRAFT_1435220 [Lentinula boryana]